MRLFVKVVADTNDADYIESFTELENAEAHSMVVRLAKALSEFTPYKGISVHYKSEWTHSHNFPHSDYLRDDLGEKSIYELYPEFTEEELVWFFEAQIIPYGENGIHTIVSIELVEVQNIEKLF